MTSPSVDPASISMSSPEFSEAGPSRKRQRTAASSEDRKEARAHRNRIAAQNSRDRRKAQFSYLEQRVSELEEENQRLRSGLVVPPQEKDRENEELRERIRTLEKGWDAVMKALAAQGLPTATTTTTPTEQSTSTPTPEIVVKQQQQTDSFPEPTMTFPISPAPTTSSLDFDLDMPSPSSFLSSPVITPKTEEPEPTRHLARVASTVPTVALQRVVSTSPSVVKPTPASLLQRKLQSTMQPWRTCSVRSSPRLRGSSRRIFLLTFHTKIPPRALRRPRHTRRK
ncbi:hypothetical protein C8F01DRAFT_227598 [Mycena amicta]|nr:hypothetical protein C8F01DRAFT_227598 [Mycena amicta]